MEPPAVVPQATDLPAAVPLAADLRPAEAAAVAVAAVTDPLPAAPVPRAAVLPAPHRIPVVPDSSRYSWRTAAVPAVMRRVR